MSVRKCVVSTFLLIILNLQCWAHAKTKDEFLLPPRSTSWWISQGDIHNEQSLFIKRFKSESSVENILEYYRAHWESESEHPGYLENEANGWKIISRLNDKFQWVVQVRSNLQGRGSVGIISNMPLAKAYAGGYGKKHKFIPMMNGGEHISSTYSDSPTPAKTQTQLYSGQPSTVANRMKRYVREHGWSLQDEFEHRNTVTQRYEINKRQLDVAFVGVAGSKTLVFTSEVAHVAN